VTPRNKFARCAERASELAETSETAQAPLAFAAGLYRVQGKIADAIAVVRGLTGAFGEDFGRFGDCLGEVLGYVAESGPGPLAEEARVRAADAASSGARLLAYWESPRAEDYLSRALLRPYAVVLAAAGIRPRRPHPEGACPTCGGRPWIAVRRSASDMDGAQRFLGCALCAAEWEVGRSRCPSCGEEDPYRLPSFRSDRHSAVRIEACETCRGYVKSLDATLDARVIPEVDELLSLSMDLWAQEQGFSRFEPGLAGV
jgi:FdhE protein